MTTPEDDVLNANRAFYHAFTQHDFSAMSELWATENMVACIHPGWHVLLGRSEVMTSWRAIFDSDEALEVRCSEESAIVIGDAAFVTCTEELQGAELVATNIFARERGGWRLVHHQSAPFAHRPKSLSPPADALN